MTQKTKTSRCLFQVIALRACLVLLFGMGGALSQSAEFFKAGIKTKTELKEEAEAGKPEEVKESAVPVDDLPSRFAGQDLDTYIAPRAAMFSMKDREIGPFGLYQNPDKKLERKITAAARPSGKATVLPSTPLIEIIDRIAVTTIMPGEKKFLVESRTFSEGDEFPLVYRGKRLLIKVVKVTGRQIHFRNQQNGDTAVFELKMLPPGMVSGTSNSRPPGVVEDGKNAPLNLSPDSNFNSTSTP